MKVVIDTNVLVSAIYWGGIPLKVLDKCLQHPYEIIISEEIWQEYCNVIRLLEERYLPGEGTLARLDYLARVSTMVETVESGPITSDPDDDIFFEAALSSGAKAIISGDKHLFDKHLFKDISVLKPRDFLKRADTRC